MPAAVTSVIGRLGRAIAAFTVAQRTIAVIGVAVLVLGVIALTSWLSRPTLTPLFTGLSPQDASAVVEQLRSGSVAYELADGGTTVLVPADSVYEQRLAAAAAGLPSGTSDGYSLLDSMGVTSSEFQQTVTYKRAIEGELARTISSLENVTTASVQLAIPEESVFVSQTVDPTASVFIETADGATLPTDQVDAIVHLTAASVSGMKPENVAVVDQQGRTLSTVGTGTAGGAGQQASAYETRITASIQQMLDKVVGAGNATVTVAAEMDHATSERIDETYTPVEGAAPTSEQTSSETYTGTGTQPGVLGGEQLAAADGGAGTYESSQTTRENPINKTTQSTSTPAGSLTRQTVAVAVDADAADAVDIAQLTALVTSAAGIDPARGDDVTVEFVAFSDADSAAAQEALAAARQAEADARTGEIVRTAVIGGIVVLVVVAVSIAAAIVLRRRSRAAAAAGGLVPAGPSALLHFDETDDALTLPLTTAPTLPIEHTPAASLPPAEPEPELDPAPGQATLDRRRAELGEFARRDPARTAELLRRLIRDKQDA